MASAGSSKEIRARFGLRQCCREDRMISIVVGAQRLCIYMEQVLERDETKPSQAADARGGVGQNQYPLFSSVTCYKKGKRAQQVDYADYYIHTTGFYIINDRLHIIDDSLRAGGT